MLDDMPTQMASRGYSRGATLPSTCSRSARSCTQVAKASGPSQSPRWPATNQNSQLAIYLVKQPLSQPASERTSQLANQQARQLAERQYDQRATKANQQQRTLSRRLSNWLVGESAIHPNHVAKPTDCHPTKQPSSCRSQPARQTLNHPPEKLLGQRAGQPANQPCKQPLSKQVHQPCGQRGSAAKPRARSVSGASAEQHASPLSEPVS